jgi:lipopolysaccharide/colanic/teichoic acid biosynthesis glycosyltransferase
LVKATRGAGKPVRQFFSYTSWKAIIERCLALIGLIILSPFLVIIAIGIRLDSPGNPLFRQERVGKDGRPFICYKFRSMYRDNDDSKYRAFITKYVSGEMPENWEKNPEAIREIIHNRVTRVGFLLRRFSLDEIPQLYNIIKGDMSFIGPRPDLPFAVAMYTDKHRKRLRVRPGLTGLWQVTGRRGLTFDKMVELDNEYIKKQSLRLDVKIILRTLGEILGRDSVEI